MLDDHVTLQNSVSRLAEVVQTLMTAGADLIGSSHDLCLETIILPTRDAVWRILDDQEYYTPFA